MNMVHNRKIKTSFVLGILLLVFLMLMIVAYFPTYSDYVSSSAWDGVTVATSFSGGNGTEENPYQIQNGMEFAYFKQVLEGTEKQNYLDKYYILTDNIDMGGHEFEPIGDHVSSFSGHFDGKSYTIGHLLLTSSSDDTGMQEYGLFRKLDQAVIRNVNLSTFSIEALESVYNTSAGILASTIQSSTIEHVSIYSATIDLNQVDATYENMAGGMAGQDLGGNQFQNLFIDITVSSSEAYSIGGVLGKASSTSTFATLVVDATIDNSLSSEPSFYGSAIGEVSCDTFYPYGDVMEDAQITSILSELNATIDEGYEWYLDDSVLKIRQLVVIDFLSDEPVEEESTLPGQVYAAIGSTYQEHASGVDGSILYVNQLEASWNRLMGRNYTTSSDGTLPGLENQYLYGENNLVRVQITYSSEVTKENGQTLVSYISLTERQNTVVYYDFFEVQTNGTTSTSDDYVLIELIDNPFTDLPAGYAFNNWISLDDTVTMRYSSTYYTRYAKVPVTYQNGVPEAISLDLIMSYTEANVARSSEMGSWDSIFSKFYEASMHLIQVVEVIIEPYDMSGYYFRRTASFATPYSGYDANGNPVDATCWNWGSGCVYYELIENQNYVEGTTYYELSGGRMTRVDNSTLPIVRTEIRKDNFDGMNMAGFYRQRTLKRQQPQGDYYDENGNALSGNCTSSNGCTVYELIQSSETFEESQSYYYLVTRDTNIAVIDSQMTDGWGSGNTKPLMVTSLYGQTDYRNQAYIDISSSDIICYNDTRIENIMIYTRSSFSNSDPAYQNNGWWSSFQSSFYGNYHNVKIGRGLVQNENYVNFNTVIGGSNNARTGSGSARSVTKYRIIVESGYMNTIGFVNASSGPTVYTEMQGIVGNDYDKVLNNNSDLLVYYCASGSWGGNIYASTNTSIAIDVVYKSGTFGSSQYDYSTGVYVGGRGGGDHYAVRRMRQEGGSIFNLIGGPLTASSRANLNDIIMEITGGEVYLITGGAGRTETYGNRIIAVTGGTVLYSVMGGSNGYTGSESTSSRGTLTGDTYLYIGGNATIGDEELINNGSLLYTVESGSVFGVGNGREEYTTIGSANHSNVIIDGNATILGSVYGGGNFGAVGTTSSEATCTTDIRIYGGVIKNNVYGGANKNGAGTTSVASTVRIFMTDGSVEKSIYGGSNVLGTIYGDTSVTVEGGTVATNVYGGGKGASTYVSGNSDVVIGKEASGPTITGSVYGGSAFGTVNATTQTTTRQSSYTHVTVYQGTISGSVFGGGQGSSTDTPYVAGDIMVTVLGGNIGNVFGGNDAAGVPNGDVYVYLDGGNIGSSYGGGNQSSVPTTHIYLRGATTDYLFGGSNTSGDVSTSYVFIENGTVTTAFGGNNIGGSHNVSYVQVTGGTVGYIYGGGNKVSTDTSYVTMLTPTANVVSAVFGGGKAADVTHSNIQVTDALIDQLFGGSNESGTVTDSTITIDGGEIATVYGGNNAGGTTVSTSIVTNGGSITNAIYGGGEEASSTTSTLTLNALANTVPYVFGGGNAASVDTSTIDSHVNAGKIYGGSNKSGEVQNSTITIYEGTVEQVFGGGNEATSGESYVHVLDGTVSSVFGGGNAASLRENATVVIENGTFTNIYGGGNFGTVLKNTTVSLMGGIVSGSVYAGGNGASAVVSGNTTLKVSGNPVIGTESSQAPMSGSLFGGGNAADTGLETLKNSIATVNITGGTIYGNVYGGANTAVVYGRTYVNVGTSAVNDSTMVTGDIYIKGTVFGGGEANAAGSEDYDFKFVNVTNGITVVINGENHTSFDILGSIFGSGNAATTEGISTIDILNYGTKEAYKKNVSIQRTNVLTIENSWIELAGAKDRTNEFSDTLFTLSIIDELKLENNSTLYLQTGTNLLKKHSSILKENGVETLEVVSIDKDTNAITKNVDNRIYMLEGKNMNIAKNEAVTSYGEVYGMTFFGMYNHDRSGNVSTGIYDSKYTSGSVPDSSDRYIFTKGSYVLGLHKLNHDFETDGFYSNYLADGEDNITVDYIKPTPDDASFYMWIIGEMVREYEVSLTASKYSTLGAVELPLLDFSKPNTTFMVLGFNDQDLDSSVSLIPYGDIPRIAQTVNDADTVMGLAMKTSNSGWITKGETNFLTNRDPNYVGTTSYVGENSNAILSLLFYLYHSKNLSSEAKMGSVTISLLAVTKIDELTNENERLVIRVNLARALYANNDYEGAITAGKQYSMFTSTVVDITSKSSFSTYYSLYSETDKTLYKEGYKRSLVSTYVFPVGTEITMIDLATGNQPEYYYYVITEDDVTAANNEYALYQEASYDFSKFTRMGSTSSNHYYNDALKNGVYYDADTKVASEEFIFIVDFKDTTITEDQLDKSLLMELRDSNGQTIINVLGIEQQSIKYDIYTGKDAVIDVSATVSPNPVYIGNKTSLDITTDFIQQKVGSNTIYDTSYFDQKLGLKITVFDSSSTKVEGTALLGMEFIVDGVKYYPDLNGVIRINVAERVANVAKKIVINLENADIATDNYTLKVESFGSPDGIYSGSVSSDMVMVPLRIINDLYGLKATTDENSKMIDQVTGETMNRNNALVYFIDYSSGLSSPNIRMQLYRRKYDNVHSTDYDAVDLQTYVSNQLEATTNEMEYMVSSPPIAHNTLFLNFKPDLMTGTYRIVFRLYDADTMIGEIYQYFIIQ